jgi:DNA polymerase V
MPVFALLDCNNFYASVERVFDARLHKRPVVVLSNNDGIVIARSQEAKDLGIGMAIPVFQVKNIIEKNNVIVKSANFELYGDMSSRVMELLEDFSPDIQIYSIDEAFFLVPGSVPLKKFGEEIREKVRKFTGLPVSVGFAKTKTLAKLANHICKKTGEITDLYNLSDAELERALAAIPVEEIWGVGPSSVRELKKHGINTALALRNTSLRWIHETLTILSARTALELQGKPCYGLTHTPDELAGRKAVSCSRSFGKVVTDRGEMREAVSFFVTRAAERMRKIGFAAGALSIKLNTDRFDKRREYRANKAIYRSAFPSDTDAELLRWAMDCLDRAYCPGLGYKKAGITLYDLVPFHSANARLVGEGHCQRLHHLMNTVDKMNRRWGRDTVHSASLVKKAMNKKEDTWHGRSNMNRSGAHTTRFQEVIKISGK